MSQSTNGATGRAGVGGQGRKEGAGKRRYLLNCVHAREPANLPCPLRPTNQPSLRITSIKDLPCNTRSQCDRLDESAALRWRRATKRAGGGPITHLEVVTGQQCEKEGLLWRHAPLPRSQQSRANADNGNERERCRETAVHKRRADLGNAHGDGLRWISAHLLPP